MGLFEVEVRYKDKVGKAAINALAKKYSNVAQGIMAEVPTNFSPTLAKTIRQDFLENYGSQEGWKDPNLTKKYAYMKDLWFSRGTKFNIGRLGTFTINHGSEVFGSRTDCIFNALAGRDGSTFSKSTTVSGENQINMNIKVGLNLNSFEGGTTRYDDEHYSQTDRNALEMFSNRITPSGEKSVLITLTGTQKVELKTYIKSVLRSAIKAFRSRN